ncbi:HEAT repeat domain-containing protein [Clostridium felsineum]|uniref:HEAT repeat domain-containing protein n=1 Tax=Clostridium felsineum TaxID=36839 RepID=UPI00098C42D8|nr:HEAT repeat domain-containing protein [Clostridium felsineum]URZ01806.1 hypothetical protein CLAUR_018030 [Clostridium felsineum]
MEKYFNKLDEIEEKEEFNEYDFEILRYFSRNPDSEIRCRVAEVLAYQNIKASEEILLMLLEDKDELVRTNACESICSSTSKEVVEFLKHKVVEDKSYLVRGYAAMAISEIAVKIGYDIKEFLIKALENEKVKWVKINFYRALYVIGEEEYLKLLMKDLDDEYYGIRCAVVNILSELASKENFEIIIETLKNRLKVEDNISVRAEIEEFIALERAVKNHKRTPMKTK